MIVYVKNSFWQLTELFFRVFSSIAVVVYIGRYLSPAEYGKLTLSISLILIFITVSRFGLDSILVRDMISFKGKVSKILASGYLLILSVSIVFWMLLLLLSYNYIDDEVLLQVVLAMSIGVLFQNAFIYDYYFQSEVKSQFSAIGKIIAMLLGSSLKIYLVYTQSDLIFFAWAFAFDHVLNFIILTVMFRKYSSVSFKIKDGLEGIEKLFRVSFPFMLSALLTILYIRADQFLIYHFLGVEELGIYAAAVKLYEGWNIAIFVLIHSTFPLLLKKREASQKDYEGILNNMLRILVVMHFLMIIFVYFFSEDIILLTFGIQYVNSADSLSILMVASLFTSFGYLNVKIYAILGYGKKVVFRAFSALFLILVIDYFVLPTYGIYGAAIAVLVVSFIVFYLMDLFDIQTRPIFFSKTKAIFLVSK